MYISYKSSKSGLEDICIIKGDVEKTPTYCTIYNRISSNDFLNIMTRLDIFEKEGHFSHNMGNHILGIINTDIFDFDKFLSNQPETKGKIRRLIREKSLSELI